MTHERTELFLTAEPAGTKVSWTDNGILFALKEGLKKGLNNHSNTTL